MGSQRIKSCLGASISLVIVCLTVVALGEMVVSQIKHGQALITQLSIPEMPALHRYRALRRPNPSLVQVPNAGINIRNFHSWTDQWRKLISCTPSRLFAWTLTVTGADTKQTGNRNANPGDTCTLTVQATTRARRDHQRTTCRFEGGNKFRKSDRHRQLPP